MALINPYKLKKDELLVLMTRRCRHGHRYIEHPACYIKEQGYEKVIGYFDIETSNLNADFGIMYSYAFKVDGEDTYYCSRVTKDELRNGTLDKRLVKDCIKDMMKFDVIITYYGTRFDIPYLRSRALYYNYDIFPMYGYIKHIDVYSMVKNKLKMHNGRLESACRFLGIEGKTHLDSRYWVRAMTGDEQALEYILEHNKKDVEITEKLYKRLEPYYRRTNISI